MGLSPSENRPVLRPPKRKPNMVLSGHEIRSHLGKSIIIDPFDESNLNPNSYNLTLHDELMVYEEVVLDMRTPSRVRRVPIPPRATGIIPMKIARGVLIIVSKKGT